LRTFENACWVAIIFILSAVFLSYVPEGPLALIPIGAALYWLFFYVWSKRVIGLNCPHCGKYIAGNTPWVCGFCGSKNQNTDEFPFLHRCEGCGAEPKGYRCHHTGCGKPIFLGDDLLEDNLAVCATRGLEVKVKLASAQRLEQRQEKEHELTIAELDEKLDAFKSRREFMKEKDPVELVKQEWTKKYAHMMAAEVIAEQERAAIEERFADNPKLRARAIALLEHWLRSRT